MASKPVAKSEIRERFLAQLNKAAETATAVSNATLLKAQRRWHLVDKGDWDGDLFNITDIGKAFSRKENEEDVAEAIKDGASPGTSGDLMVSVMQGDYLAAQERAFRVRHQSRARADIHAAARRMGHAHDKGIFKRGIKGVIENILKQSKSGKT
jgi:hypothetical protein|tara:strand:+ start:1320 stop:1781 length:462 start_codon:yes stop_codon:yes gene_type:complete